MAGTVTPGRRIYVPEGGKVSDLEFQPGDYCLHEGVLWHNLPSPALSAVYRCAKHTITEHEDGTITVSPSILSTWGDGANNWHGYLERGVWREC